jgi:MFS transporter, putative metabolite:H+ symporter
MIAGPRSAGKMGTPQNPPDLHVGMIGARLDRLPATWTVWRLVVLLSLGFFFELYDLLYSGYVAPGLVRSGLLHGPNGVAAFISALFAGLFAGTIGCGFLADRFGRRAIFTCSLLFYTAANLIMAFQVTATGIYLWRFLAGIGIGVELVTIGAYISELVPKHIRGRAFACEQAVGFTAVPVAAFLSYLLVPHKPFGMDGWRWVVIIGAHGAIFVWFIRRALPESPRWLAQKGRLAEAERVIAMLEDRVTREFGRPLPALESVPVSNIEDIRFTAIWRPPLGKRTLMLVIFHVCQTVGFYGFGNWVPTLLARQGISFTSSLLYSSIIALAAPVGPLIGLWMGDEFERKNLIIASAAGIILCGLIFSQSSHAVLLIAMGVGLTLASNIMSFNFHAYQAELFPTSIRSMAVGFVYSWSRFSAIFTAFVIAAALKNFGTTGVFVLIAAAMLIVVAVIGALGPRTRNLSLEEISS